MKRFAIFWAVGMVLSCAWIALANLPDVDPFARGWWAGAICTTATMLAFTSRRQEPRHA